MIKKSIFIVLAMFGLNSVADMHDTGSEVDHMSDMMQSGSDVEDSGFWGAVEFKYKALGVKEDGKKEPSYRVRVGWKGEMDEVLKWGVGISSPLEEQFDNPKLSLIYFEQAYVSYSPIEGFKVKAGKYNWQPKFHKTGVLYDDDLYLEGVSVKYHQGDDDVRFYGKVALHHLAGDYRGPFNADVVFKGKVGGSYALSSDMKAGLYVSGEYDGLFMEKASEGEEKASPTTLAQVGVNFSTSSMMFPVGLFGVYVTNAKGLTKSPSYTGGVYVGNAGTSTSGEMGDFGVAVSYYDFNAGDYNPSLVDSDYGALAGQGVAARAQYNLWDSVNVVAKYAYNLAGGDNANHLVGEMTFNF